MNQGTTDFFGSDNVRKDESVLRGRAAWGRATVAGWIAERSDVVALELHDRPDGLGEGYEMGDIASIAYRRGAVPPDDLLLRDARDFGQALGELYRVHARAPIPFESPEVEAVLEAAAVAAGKPSPRRGAAYRVNADERKAIEEHAVRVAKAYYEQDGWSVKVLGKPYDLDLKRGSEKLTVEVEGTTSDGLGLSLTDGEVRHHEKAHPNNALVVVRNITLHRGSPPKATGGRLHEIRPWMPSSDDLRVVSYAYAVPPAAYVEEDAWAAELLLSDDEAVMPTRG